MGQYAVAERYLQRAMEINPRQGVYYHQQGLIRYRQKQWRAALELFNRALEVGSGSNEASVWRSIGDVQLELFDREAAVQAYTESLRLQPRDARTHFALGRFYLDKGEPDPAIEHLRTALEVDPSLGAAFPLLGRAYSQKGDLPSALSILKKALKSNPADQESRYALGRTLLAMGRVNEGREELDKFDRNRQQILTANNNYNTAVSRLSDGKVSEAEALLREAVHLAPTYGPALHSLGALLLDRGSPDTAVGFLQRAVEATPLNAAPWYSLGEAYSKSGKLSEAFEAAKRAAVLDEDNEQYQRLLGEIRQRLSK
jgi:tetratricopeptide (TPR) repeat protein